MCLQTYRKDKDIIERSIFEPHFRPEYQLMFGSQNYYMFFKQIYTIYERLTKARDLINSKIDEDLSFKQEERYNHRA